MSYSANIILYVDVLRCKDIITELIYAFISLDFFESKAVILCSTFHVIELCILLQQSVVHSCDADVDYSSIRLAGKCVTCVLV